MKRDLKQIGKSAYESIEEMVARLSDEDDDKARRAIHEDALSCEVRSDWCDVGDMIHSIREWSEFRILLATGGPAVRIVGELTNGEPSAAKLEVQDWGTPWTEYEAADEAVLLCYASVFYWGE